MKNIFAIFLIAFVLFGMLLPAGFVLADSHDKTAPMEMELLRSIPFDGYSDNNEVVCTQDVKECKDGTFVSRNSDLNCAFNQCPDKDRACGIFSDAKFRSTDTYEKGLSPSGVVMGYWNIIFSGGEKVVWTYSDIVQSGSFTCDEGKIEANLGDLNVEAEYDANQEILIWDGIEYKIEGENDEDDKRERTRKRIERDRERLKIREDIKRDFREDGRRVEIERKIEVNDDGTFKIKIKRKITNADGTVITKVLIIERDEDGIKKRLKIEGIDGLEVETELEIDDEFEGNETDVAALLSNGRRALIKVMPDAASDIALKRLKALNFTRIELKEVRHNNELRAVYEVEANKNGKFLGIFKMKVRFRSDIDSETGEVLNLRKPWWAFLVTGEDSDQTDNSTNDSVAAQ